jgi:hypothetical protein
MWDLFKCYLSGRHEYGPWSEPGTIFLRCVHCGKRSSGWAIGPDAHRPQVTASVHVTASAKVVKTAVAPAVMTQATDSRVLPFGRVAAR